VSPGLTTRRDIFDADGWWKCKVNTVAGMVKIRTGEDIKGREAPNPWLEPAAARRLALALLVAAIEVEGEGHG
jgi:hypothetical protein